MKALSRERTTSLSRWVTACILVWLAAAPSVQASPKGKVALGSAERRADALVFVPGVTGTQLYDPRNDRLVWGTAAQMMRPRDGGNSLALPLSADDPNRQSAKDHPQSLYQPVEPMWELHFLTFEKQIYRPLADFFEEHGFRRGPLEDPKPEHDFFFFLYDWRRSNLESVARLDQQLAKLAQSRGLDTLEVDLLCQSNAAKICRYLAKHGAQTLAGAESAQMPAPKPYRLRKVVLVGASNGGALRVLEQLHRGRRHIARIGRKLQPESMFTVRSLFEDLPIPQDNLFFGPDGNRRPVDLYSAQTWVEYGWSIFQPDARRRLRRGDRRDIFGTEDDRVAYLERQLSRAQRLHQVLLDDSPHWSSGHLSTPSYYLLENDSQPTINAAMLSGGPGDWKLSFFDDKEVARDPELLRHARADGDGHATLESQRLLSPQERRAVVRAVKVDGGHFEMLIAPEGLEALLGFLRE